MNYKKIYTDLIESRRNRKFQEDVLTETHHILPKSMGGSNNEDNLIELTPREHFIAHWLLFKIYRNRQMAGAFALMSRYNKTSYVYEATKNAMSLIQKGTKLSESTKKKMSISASGKKRTQEHQEKLAQSRRNRPQPKITEINNQKRLQKYSHLLPFKNEIIKQRLNGVSLNELSKKYNIYSYTLAVILRKDWNIDDSNIQKDTSNYKKPKLWKQNTNKLDNKIKEVTEIYKNTKTWREISRHFGVDSGTIKRLLEKYCPDIINQYPRIIMTIRKQDKFL